MDGYESGIEWFDIMIGELLALGTGPVLVIFAIAFLAIMFITSAMRQNALPLIWGAVGIVGVIAAAFGMPTLLDWGQALF